MLTPVSSDSGLVLRMRHLWSATRYAAALCALLAAQGAARAETIQLGYVVSLLGLPLGRADARAKLGQTHYFIEAEAKLTGIAALVARSKGAATAWGSIRNGRVAPSDYATTSANADITRTIRMAMDNGDVKAVDIRPPFHDLPGRIPVTKALKRKIVDPMSALIMTVPANEPLTGPSACDRVIPVYDGWIRFNINLDYIGSRKIRIPGYSGPVSICSARYVPIAGHRPDRPATRFMASNRRLFVWLAPFPNRRIELPVRISIATMIGTLVLRATNISYGGAANLNLFDKNLHSRIDKRPNSSPAKKYSRP